MESSQLDNSQVAVHAPEIRALAKESPDVLAALATPDMYEYEWPPILLAMWALLLEKVNLARDFSKIAIGFPRGFAKTTFIKLFLLFVILFTDRKFILVLAATHKLAVNIIGDIQDMLDEPNIKALFGDWRIALETDTQDLKKFTFRGRSIVIAGLGAGGSVRGLNIKDARPDVMVFDDIQSREAADSEEVSEGILRWMIGTAMKAKSPKGCLTFFVANMYPTPHSILKKLKYNPEWIKFIAGGILQNPETGEYSSFWEALQPLEQLLAEWKADAASGHPEIFASEVLNDENATVNTQIDLSKVPEHPVEPGDISAGGFIVIDPATGKTNRDAIAIGYFEVHEGRPSLRELRVGSFSPGDTIRHSLELGITYGCRLIAIESVAYQATLGYWFAFICAQKGITGFRTVEFYPGGTSKNSRILTMFKSLLAGETLVDPSQRTQVWNQISAFNPLRTDNRDDILDLLAIAPRILTEHSALIVHSTVIENQAQAQESAAVDWELVISDF